MGDKVGGMLNPMVPFLRQARAGGQIAALAWRLDEQGTFPAIQQERNGQAITIIERDGYLDAEQLLEAIRQIVREELKAAQ